MENQQNLPQEEYIQQWKAENATEWSGESGYNGFLSIYGRLLAK